MSISPFPTISLLVMIASIALIALATPDPLCWITSVMVSLMVSMPSSSYSVSNRFLNSSWTSLTLFVWHLLLLASRHQLFFLSTSTFSLMVRITSSATLGLTLFTRTTWYVPFLFKRKPSPAWPLFAL